jgi:hypothetical protein
MAKDLRPVYTAPTEAAAKERFVEFAASWGQRYPAIVRLWENAWSEFVPFLDYDVEIRRVICSTDEIRNPSAWRGSCCPGPIPPRPARQAEIAGPQPGSRWSAPLDERP